MQIYTENRFCLPLFYLGVALSIWISPDKAFATGASSGVHDDQLRQAPEGLPPSRMPEAFPGFSPDTPSRLSPRSGPLTPAGSRAACSPCRCLRTSPPNSSRPRSPSCARPNPILRSFISNYVKRLWNFITFLSRPTRPLTPGRHRAQAHPPAYRGHTGIAAYFRTNGKARRVQSRLGRPRARHRNGRSEPTTPQRTERGVIPSRRSRGSHAPERSVAVFFLATSAHPGFSLCDSYTLSNIPVQILYSFSEQRKAHQRRYIDDYIENRIVNMFGTGIAIVQARVTNKTPFRRTSMSLNKASIAVALAAFLAVAMAAPADGHDGHWRQQRSYQDCIYQEALTQEKKAQYDAIMKEFADKTAPLRDKLAAKYIELRTLGNSPVSGPESHRQGDGRTRGAPQRIRGTQRDGGQGRQGNRHQYISRQGAGVPG